MLDRSERLYRQAMTLSVDPNDLYCRRCCKRMSAPTEDAGVAQGAEGEAGLQSELFLQ